MSEAKIQMGAVVQAPQNFRRVKCRVLPTVKVRMKAEGAKGQVVTINEEDFNAEIHVRAGRIPLKQAKKPVDEGEAAGEAG